MEQFNFDFRQLLNKVLILMAGFVFISAIGLVAFGEGAKSQPAPEHAKSKPAEKAEKPAPSTPVEAAKPAAKPASQAAVSQPAAKEAPQVVPSETMQPEMGKLPALFPAPGESAGQEPAGLTPASSLMEQDPRQPLTLKPKKNKYLQPLRDLGSAVKNRLPGSDGNSTIDENMHQVSYYPLTAIAVFPVIRHGQEKAFADLPVLFADEFATQLDEITQGTKVLNPVYTVEELKTRGLGGSYQRMVDFYIKSGQPHPQELSYLLHQLNATGTPIQRVAFVEADVDMNSPEAPQGFKKKLQSVWIDQFPSEMQYYIRSRIRVFDTSSEQYQLIWDEANHKAVSAKNTYNVTPSVYQDSDSLSAFGLATRRISHELLTTAPEYVYLEVKLTPITAPETSVQGQIISPSSNAGTPIEALKLTEEDKSLLNRILNRSSR